jgi:hypothetical protein
LFFATSERDVRDGVDPFPWVREHALVYLVGPELPGDLEFFVDGNGFGNFDSAADFGSVVEFAECGVPGAGVIPRGGGFLSGSV